MHRPERPPPALDIRAAEPGDVEALGPLFQGYRAFYEVESDLDACRRFLRERLERGDAAILVASLAAAPGREPCGFALLYPSYSSLRGARAWILNDLFVHPAARGRGAGRALLDHVRAFARSTGAEIVSLATQRSNRVARALYESAGFVRDEEFDHYELVLR